jgi:hypothetical protein
MPSRAERNAQSAACHRKRRADPVYRAARNAVEAARLRRKRARTPREAEVENYLREQIEARDGLCMKFIDPGQRGAPDRIVVLHGCPSYYVELKRPKMGKLWPRQVRYNDRLRARGQQVWVLWSKEDVDEFIAEVTLT